jgi:hypothetical protein
MITLIVLKALLFIYLFIYGTLFVLFQVTSGVSQDSVPGLFFSMYSLMLYEPLLTIANF